MHHIVYLHGFLSSPQSDKAQKTIAFAKQHYPAVNIHVPQLPGDINRSVNIIDNLVNTLPKSQLGFIGSSMGGFLATYCMEKYTQGFMSKAVLVNPAVEPFNLLNAYLGKHLNPYTNESFFVLNQHISKLRQLNTTHLHNPKKYKVLLQTADETLDYRLAQHKYYESMLTIEEGGNHSFVNYEAHLADIFAFLLHK